jgi:hypothetical protein
MTKEIPDEGYIVYIDEERIRKVYRTLGHAKCAIRAQGSKFSKASIARLVPREYGVFIPKYDDKGHYVLEELKVDISGGNWE